MSKSPREARIDRALPFLLAAIAVMLVAVVILTVVFFVTKPASNEPAGTESGTSTPVSSVPDTDPDGITLPETPDAGQAYQDKLTFVGDSLTAHLVSRGVLTGGKETKQVWRTENNMLNLNSEVESQLVRVPGTEEFLTIAELAAREKPEILIITLGTDYGVAYLSEADFKACYTGLVNAVKTASPETKIILQSIFPVTDFCQLKSLTNEKIDIANGWVKAIAAETGCRYLDTQSILKDQNNYLKAEYCIDTDGIHLTADAYRAILTYIRTHALTD